MNLIICCTPLQTLIAERIINSSHGDDFFLLMLTSKDNRKNFYYFDKINSNVLKYKKIIILDAIFSSQNHLFFYRIYSFLLIKLGFFSFLKELKQLKFNKVFLAYISDINSQLILSNISFQEIYTYDDGTANIVKSSFLYQNKQSVFKQIIKKVLGVKYSINLIKQIAKCHYTLYPEIDNIIKYTVGINLIEPNIILSSPLVMKKNNNNNVIRIMLGQVIFKDVRNKLYIEKIIEEYRINYYFPSPRENYDFYENKVEIIQSEMVFEDYFINNWIGNKCIIYTFCSSAALNIHNLNLDFVKVISLKPENIERQDLIECYRLLDWFGISVIPIYLH